MCTDFFVFAKLLLNSFTDLTQIIISIQISSPQSRLYKLSCKCVCLSVRLCVDIDVQRPSVRKSPETVFAINFSETLGLKQIKYSSRFLDLVLPQFGRLRTVSSRRQASKNIVFLLNKLQFYNVFRPSILQIQISNIEKVLGQYSSIIFTSGCAISKF